MEAGEQHDQRFLAFQTGYVVDRSDPAGLARVRLKIPGLIDRSAWALPLGVSGGGSKDRGVFNVPENGAEVGVLFKGGDPDRPYYLPAHWGAPRGEKYVPDASDGGNPDVTVLAFGAYDVVIDRRGGSKKFRIVDKAADDNVIEYDGVTRTLQISATTAIRIEATGAVEINGLTVSINGIPAGSGRL